MDACAIRKGTHWELCSHHVRDKKGMGTQVNVEDVKGRRQSKKPARHRFTYQEQSRRFSSLCVGCFASPNRDFLFRSIVRDPFKENDHFRGCRSQQKSRLFFCRPPKKKGGSAMFRPEPASPTALANHSYSRAVNGSALLLRMNTWYDNRSYRS